ncbi:hypothetical protein CANINC_000230 [Pichia inconspicua]|uniref:RING-type domain-containing protein n=1 Tax=Pichia inconspicua TaxID=52247 RepID=A0A4T0X731_9ASCO|nr:hypothetical protein CANINC_000230 [[Candida] inconspicua]
MDKRKLIGYYCFSMCLVGLHIAMKYYSSPNLYILGLKCSQNDSILIIGNAIVASFLLYGTLFQYLIFGELRLIETSHLHERLWANIIGLVMTGSIYINHNSTISVYTLIFAVSGLLFFKAMHSIASDRLDYLIQQHFQKANAKFSELLLNRIVLTTIILLRLDYSIIKMAVDESLTSRSAVILMIAFEYVLIMVNTVYSSIKYGLDVFEIRYLQKYPDDEIWPYKVWFDSILKIMINLAKSIIVPVLFLAFLTMETVSFNLVGEIFRSFYALGKSIKTLFRLIRNSKKLNKSLKKPTAEEVENADICIICRDDLIFEGTGNARSIPVKLNCGHILHDGCIRGWLEMSTDCPTCRKPVISDETHAIQPPQPPQLQRQLQPQLQPQPQPQRQLRIENGDAMVNQIEARNGLQNSGPNEGNEDVSSDYNYQDYFEYGNSSGNITSESFSSQRQRFEAEQMLKRIQAMIDSIEQVGTLNMTDSQRENYEELKETAHRISSDIQTNYSNSYTETDYYINLPPGSVVPVDWTVLPVENSKGVVKVKLNRNKSIGLKHLRNPNDVCNDH